MNLPFDKLQEILQLCEKAIQNEQSDICVVCNFNHKTFRHKYGCEIPEYRIKTAANPETVKAIIEELLELRNNQKEILKSSEDLVLYGSGFLKIQHVPIDKVIPDEITDTERLDWVIEHGMIHLGKGEYVFIEDYQSANRFKTPREAIDDVMRSR